MARPITPTPKLDVKASKAFLRNVKRDLAKPARLLPTPRLDQARDLVRRHALKRAE